MWYAGWDGGGTKTEVCVLDESGEVIADESFGPLNPNGASPEKVRRTVRDAVDFMSRLPGGAEACGGMVIGAAGLSNHQTGELICFALQDTGWPGGFRLVGDQEIALAGAIDSYGAILIAGTGSICHGRTPEGEFFRVGGYGYLIDDEGSGYALGRDMLKAAVRAFDGRGSETILTGMIREALQMKKPGVQEMITWLYRPETGKKEIASLTRLLPDALANHDAVSIAIAEKAARELADLVIAGWRKSKMKDGELAVTGSILQKIPFICQKTESLIHEIFPDIRIIAPRRSPALGAARMAIS